MTIEDAKAEAQAGFEQANKDVMAARQALDEAGARLNYFKGQYEALAKLTPPATPPSAD